MQEKKIYNKLTVEGDIQTKWICGCHHTIDGFFKFCAQHNDLLKKKIEIELDSLDRNMNIK